MTIGVWEGGVGRDEGGERVETNKTTKSIQIETGDITPISSVPRKSSMLPSIADGYLFDEKLGRLRGQEHINGGAFSGDGDKYCIDPLGITIIFGICKIYMFN